MSECKKDSHANVRTGPTIRMSSLRGNRQDKLLTSGSVPVLPPLTCLSPAFVCKPPHTCILNSPHSSHPAELSMFELPQLVAKVGPEVAVGESMWTEGPCLMASALGADIPIRVIKTHQELKSTPADEAIHIEKNPEAKGTNIGTESRSRCSPLSGFEVYEIFAKKRHLGELPFYHLEASNDIPYRPYDLQVVPRNKAGSDYYIFSPTSVIHVQNGCSVELLTLAEWHHEAVLWKALRDIPFFRDYQLHKAFRRWHRNIRHIVFQHKCKLLHSQLLIAVPQFREALFHFTRFLEELKEVHWLPQDETRTYTLLEFQTTLLKHKQESEGVLERFLHYNSLILAMIQETSYKAHQELQHRLEQSQLNLFSQPMCLQQASTAKLSKELKRAEQVLRRLGNTAALMDCMIVQSLVTIVQHEIMTFFRKCLKREQKQQGSLFQAELTFGADGQLFVFPSIYLFQEVLLGALRSVGDSTLKVLDLYSNSADAKADLTASFQDLSSHTGLASSTDRQNAQTNADRNLSSIKEPCFLSVTKLVLPKLPSLRLRGQRVQGQYNPLSRKQLEWHLHLHDETQEIEKEQARITQEAKFEIEQFCKRHSCLVDTHLFTNQWSRSSLENMRGWPALKYKEHFQKLHSWKWQISTMPSAFTTSNKLLTITCSHIQEKLGCLLTSTEKDSLRLVSDELQLHSANLTSELQKALEILQAEPTDYNNFLNYAGMVQYYKGMTDNLKQQLDYLFSLQSVIQLNCENITPGDVVWVGQILNLWEQFSFLTTKATDSVTQHLPSMINTLNSTFSSLSKQLEDLVYSATTGPYLDPHQRAEQMVAELTRKCGEFHEIAAKLSELSRSSQNLKGQPLDLVYVTTSKQHIEAQKELWELKEVSSSQIQEWKLLLFSKFAVSRAQEKVNEWLQQAVSLAGVLPAHNAVLQVTSCSLERFREQLSILAKLSSPTLKIKHWRNIFKGMGLQYSPEQNLTVAELMSKDLLQHQHKIYKICREAHAAADMEHEFQKLQQSWDGTIFRLARFIVTVWQTDCNSPQQHLSDSGTFTIKDLEMLLAQTEDSVMTLSSMLHSPHATEFRRKAEHWLQLLQELEELLDFCERYQQKWVFLSKILYETSVSTQNVKLLEKFSPVDKNFRELIQFTVSDPHVLNFVQLQKTTDRSDQFHGQNLRILFSEGLTAMEEICNQLLHLLDSPRAEFPRLCFLSNGEVMRLLYSNLTPTSLLPLVRKCFRGVRWLEFNKDFAHGINIANDCELSSTKMWVRGVYGTLMEHMPFICPLEPNLNSVVWLGLLEEKLYEAVKQLMLKCIFALPHLVSEPNGHEEDKQVGGSYSPDHDSGTLVKEVGKPSDVLEPPAILSLISEYPVQCLLVSEEVLWCNEIQKAFLKPDQSKWVKIKSQNAAKIRSLCQAIRSIVSHSNTKSLASQHFVTALRALVLLTMKHAQQVAGLAEVKGSLEYSFEWQKLIKYQYSVCENWNRRSVSQDPDCTTHSVYLDVLGTQFTYGYEYIGPEDWMMVNTPSTEQAFLGILLALTSYKCSCICGPLMSGKKQTVLQLGFALGLQVITLGCCASTSISVVCQMLSGALQTGAWLVLNSVDSMEQGSLSILGQHLTDIQQCLSRLQRNAEQKAQKTENFATSDETDGKVQFGGKNISAKLSFGCVLISSKGYSSELPENLRVASRPVSLVQPDYRIIAEVLLVSLGYSEASSISSRLFCLFNLSKDSCCLPDLVCRDECSWLVLLKKIIYASGAHLHNNFEKNDEDRFLACDGQRPVDITLKETDKIPKELQDCHSSLYKCRCKLSVVNAVREEQAIIKAVMFVLLPSIIEDKRASQFRTILEQIFPTARFFIEEYLIEQREENLIRTAVTEELEQTGLCADRQILHNTMTLYQTLRFTKAVVLVGPPGSGKTVSYRALAGALRRLAAQPLEGELMKVTESAKLPSTPFSCSVNTVVLFPNGLSHEELFGGCVKHTGSRFDGALTKLIRDTEWHDQSVNYLPKILKKRVVIQNAKWLVLDGELLNKPGWFDFLGTLSDPRQQFLNLPSGEKVQPSQSEFKIIVETTSIKDATPSALAQCSLVYVSGKDLWKAVWKAEVDALYRDHTLDQSTLNMWTCLAEDLFSRTLNFIRHNLLSNIMSGVGQEGSRESPGIINGLQEVTSFIKIFHALLKESGSEHCMTTTTVQTEARDVCLKSIFRELQARNLFVIAYIWGFGGQLHPRHWPQFDLLAKEALFESRYRIEVPAGATVFEHFFSLRGDMMEDTTNIIKITRKRRPLHFYTSVPQYEKHAYILDLMLEAHQPVLLIGEASSGKTTLCKSLLSQERPHMHLVASPLLHSNDLQNVFESTTNKKTGLDSLILFVDDLHAAPFDNKNTSILLETLRQCMSRNGVLTSDSCRFKSLSSGAINYLVTCSTFGPNNSTQISPRLLRLFTIFVLPSMTTDILFSIHSTKLQQWLKTFPSMSRIADMAHSIISATFDVYLAVCENLHTPAHSPHIMFSLHDLQKVFQGMRLLDPRTIVCQSCSSSALPAFSIASLGPAANVLSIAQLWAHECWRTFGDRLSAEEDVQTLMSVLTQVSEEYFGSRLVTEPQSSGDCQSKQENTEILNQHEPLILIQQDNNESITSREEFDKPFVADVIFNQESESSEEWSTTDSSFIRSESDEDDYSLISSSRGSEKMLEFKSKKEPSTATWSPEMFGQTPIGTQLFKSAGIKISPSISSHSELDQCDISTCEKAQTSSKQLQQLLNEVVSSTHNMVYSSEHSEPHKCIPHQQPKHKSVYQRRDLDMLVQQVSYIIKRIDKENHCKSVNFVFRKRVCQLAHILRVLLIPGGHGVLFGAAKKTGRKTTIRLAAELTGSHLVEIHSGNADKLKEIMREAVSGRHVVDGGHVIFLIHEDISPTIKEKLLMVMADGTIPELYYDEKQEDAAPNIAAIEKKPYKCLRNTHFIEKNKQRNLHMFLLMPLNQVIAQRQTGQTSLTLQNMTKVLSLCSCVEVYQPWSYDTLVEIASDQLDHNICIAETDVQTDKTLMTSIAQVMAGIHQSAIKYATTLLNIVPFSPQTYSELISYFIHLCGHLREQNARPANRVAIVLARVKDMTDTADKYSQEILRLQAKFDETQKWFNHLKGAVDTEHKHCEQTRQQCLLEEGQLFHLEEQLQRIEQQAQDTLKEVSPLYQAACKALQSLNQSDIDEVRHYRHPPDGVVMLMNALCMLFNRQCNWDSSKQLLGQPNFLQELEFFDRSKLSNELFEKLGQIVQAPNFQPHLVRDISRACESLSYWLQAVYQYACVQRQMAPQEAQKNHLNKCMAESRGRLRVARLQEEAAQGKLEEVEKQHQLIRRNLEELAAQLQKAQNQEKEAAAAVNQLNYYIEKWNSVQKETEMNILNISGDALILAAAIVYLGPFDSDIRLDLLETWHKMCLTGRITISPEDSQTPLLDVQQSTSAHIPVSMDLQGVLAQAIGEDHPIQAVHPHPILKLLLWGHKVPWAQRRALLANKQQYEELSSQTILGAGQLPGNTGGSPKDDEYELVVSADDPKFCDKLKHGAEKGLKVLITHFECAVPSEDILNMLNWPPKNSPEFCLFLSTPLPVHILLDEIHPLFLEKVNVIDLSLSTPEVKNIILTNVIQPEVSKEWLQSCQAKTNRQVLQELLHLEEASLMEYTLQSLMPLLQDPEFLPRVSVCQSTSLRLKAEIKELSDEIDGNKPLLDEFDRIALLATDLYKALQEVGRLSPFYFFPLHNYLNALQEALALKGNRDFMCNGEIVSGAIMSEVSHKMVSHIFAQYRPCLLQSHAEVLSLLVSVVFFKYNEGCSDVEKITFLKGIHDKKSLDDSTSETSDSKLPSWIPLHLHADICVLEKIPPFHGLVCSLKNSSRQWQEYLRFPSSTVIGPVPCQSHSHLTTLQRAILWRTFFPQWLAAVSDDLAACQHGELACSPVATGPHTGSPEALSHLLSKNKWPVIVTLPSQSRDGLGNIHPLYWIKDVAQYQAENKGVKVTVITFGTECQGDVVLSALHTAVQTGHWLVLNNCHLLNYWDIKVVTQLRRLMSYMSKGVKTEKGANPVGECAGNHVHSNFRLWFITKGDAPNSVPAVIRGYALHLVCDSHWGLRDELCSSLRKVTSTALLATSSRNTGDTVPLIPCAILHSVLLQRQKVNSQGQHNIYYWTEEDLLALATAQLHIAKHCSDPSEAMVYIAAYLIYGGHVSNHSDLKAVEAVCRICIQPASPMGGIGPHTLSEIIRTGSYMELPRNMTCVSSR
ncbi:dynein heavy chain domain-containing protein 1 [Hoplias malabaricus]|uniref:dynein heavy chain domain-containing protein 1 n=1 Tax=Hoplias malabaricus TaxID=27720 RepID=UPI0034625138